MSWAVFCEADGNRIWATLVRRRKHTKRRKAKRKFRPTGKPGH